mmetsp:Transcript_23399/g.40937  ORF Transcript_23399/g.40937 Transcript_23399/m.40937 type:complete len:213 (-) Transcript_23399:2221-2859(-)
MRIQIPFAEPDRIGRDFNQFVVVDIGDCLFQRHGDRRGQSHGFVCAGCAHVGQLFALQRVHFQVVVTAVFADDHAGINIRLRADEHAAALFEVPQGKGHGLAVLHRDQHTGTAARDRPLVGRPFVKHAVQHARAARVGQKFAVISDQPARWHMRHNAGLSGSCGLHLDQFTFAHAGQFFDHGPGILVIDVNRGLFDWLVADAVDVLKQDLGA